MLNRIFKIHYPDIWSELFEYEIKDFRDHRRNSNFYCVSIFEFDKDNCPNHPEIHGLWESDCFIKDTEYGWEKPDELYRVEEKQRTITETYYERVK